jgi:hypothetical protein
MSGLAASYGVSWRKRTVKEEEGPHGSEGKVQSGREERSSAKQKMNGTSGPERRPG